MESEKNNPEEDTKTRKRNRVDRTNRKQTALWYPIPSIIK